VKPPEIDARTRLVALLGDPVEHSLSPVFQNAAFAEAGVPGIYLALRTDEGSLVHLLRGIAGAGGAGNVTLPHKESAVDALDRATGAVARTGACNTFWQEHGHVWGDNTDVQGFRAAVGRLVPGGARDARVLLIGAGGAARAALAGLEDEGAGSVIVLNRTQSRARELIARHASGRLSMDVAPDAASLRGEHFDLVVNCTSLGLRPGDPLPIPVDGVRMGAALDLVYAPGGTRWTRDLSAAGIAAADGVEMLVEQGAAAFERWWGRPAPVQTMRRSLLDLG
jgi:shikimate dehydrogenase